MHIPLGKASCKLNDHTVISTLISLDEMSHMMTEHILISAHIPLGEVSPLSNTKIQEGETHSASSTEERLCHFILDLD